MSKLDLTDLISSTRSCTKDEALDLLGDLLSSDVTGLFGDAPAKISKPRPKWQVDGFIIVNKVCHCKTCGKRHVDVNPLILLSESLVDHEGRVLKSQKTSTPESIRQAGVDFSELEIIEEAINVDDIAFCSHCIRHGITAETVQAAFRNQIALQQLKATNDALIKSASALKATRESTEEAEKKLFELLDRFERPDSVVRSIHSDDDTP